MIFIETRNGGVSRVRKEPEGTVAVNVLIPSELKTEAAGYAKCWSLCTRLPDVTSEQNAVRIYYMCFVDTLSVAKICDRFASWKGFRGRNLGGKSDNRHALTLILPRSRTGTVWF